MALIDELKNVVLAGNCVAVVGAGMEIPAVPDWWHTVQAISKRCGVPFDPTRSLLTIIDECIDKDEAIYRAALCHIMPRTTAVTRTAVSVISRLPFHAILTSNFDPRLALEAQHRDYPRVIAYPWLTTHKGYEKTIVFFHGQFDSEDASSDPRQLVFGEKSFLEAYSPASLLPGLLQNVLTFRDVLFLGFNPTENHIANIISNSISTRRTYYGSPIIKEPEPARYMLVGLRYGATKSERAKHDAYLQNLDALKITPIVFPRSSKDFREIDQILRGWVDEGEIGNRPPAFDTGI